MVRAFGARTSLYETLGVTASASAEDIKAAYKALAKKYHPDVGGKTASEEKFRQVTEAYTVLANIETRVKYDLLATSEVAKVLDSKKEGANAATFAPHEYGYQRLKELAEERKKYNLDKFYRYKGGVPERDRGDIRTGAHGPPGSRAETHIINEAEKGQRVVSPETESVDHFQAEQFKQLKNTDSQTLTKRSPYLPLELDYEFHKGTVLKQNVTFWLGVFGLIWGLYFIDEVPKLQNRLKIKELLAKKEGKLVPAGMRAVSLPN